MSESEKEDEVATILVRARQGSILAHGDQGPPESAGWRSGRPAPSCLLLHDLELGALPAGFGRGPAFAAVTELDLSGNGLTRLPPDAFADMPRLRTLFLGGPGPKFTPAGATCNTLRALPRLDHLVALEHLSLHDNDLPELPALAGCVALRTLRADRNPLRALPALPSSLRVLHLEGCPLGGSPTRPGDLPPEVRALGDDLEDLQMPDGSHVGTFFGTPLGALLRAAPSEVDP